MCVVDFYVGFRSRSTNLYFLSRCLTGIAGIIGAIELDNSKKVARFGRLVAFDVILR